MARKVRAAPSATATAASAPVVVVPPSIATSGTRSKRKASAVSVAVSVATPAVSMGATASSSSPSSSATTTSVASTSTASVSSSAISPALKKRRTARANVNAIPFPALYGSKEVIDIDDDENDDDGSADSDGFCIVGVATPASAPQQQQQEHAPPRGRVVRPDFHVTAAFATQARVLHQHGEYLDAMLTRACVHQGQNEFALLQVLAMPGQGFYLWSRSGVVGATGDTVMEGPWPEAYEAIKRFRALFLSKTFYHWDERHVQQYGNGGYMWIETHQTIVGEEEQAATAAEAEATATPAAAATTTTTTTPQRKRRSTKKPRARAPRKVKPKLVTEVQVARASLPSETLPPPSRLDTDVQSFMTMAIDAASAYSDNTADHRYYAHLATKQLAKKTKSTATSDESVLVPIPLGKLSKATIQEGFEALHRVYDALQCDAVRSVLTTLSSQFYSLVPQPQLSVIDSMVRLAEKVEMLVALSVHGGHDELLRSALMQRYFATNHLDACYDALDCRLMPLLPTSKEFGLVQSYMFNSFCCVGNNYGAHGKLLTVFRVEKQTESARFEAYRHTPNRRVLWHGSRMSNWMGILKHGLLITPTGVPLNGSSLGAGLYFTDKISKAMVYSHASHDRQVFLLSEVALGTCKPSHTGVRTAAASATTATSVHHSCHGVGRCVPDKNGDHVDALGAVWPLGKPTQAKDTRVTHDHNEFVVYNTAQARMRYVVVTQPLY